MQKDKRYYLHEGETSLVYRRRQLNQAIRTMENDMEGVVDIPARNLGWRAGEHSDFRAADDEKRYYFADIYAWYLDLFETRKALPRGKD
jgi:hypothetical protein